MRKAIIFVLIMVCLLPNAAFADGGGPLLLIINGMAFLYGGILIIIIEWLIYVFWAKIPKLPAFLAAVLANIVSTMLVGFGVPLLVAAFFALLSIPLPQSIGSFALALGTWVYEGVAFPKLMMASTVFWWIVTFFLTVYVEKLVLQRRWKARQFEASRSASSLSWISNSVTYLGLLGVLIWFLGVG